MSQATQSDGVTRGLAAGTVIATLDGMRAVETIAPGDRVVTYDRGAQPVLRADPAACDAALVHLPAGALDNDTPLYVMPGQRLMWADWHTELLFGAAEVLVEARDLIGMNGIGWAEESPGRILRLAFAKTDMMLVGGTWGETCPDGEATARDGRAARLVLSAAEARVLRSYGDYQSRPAETVRAPAELRRVA